MRKLESIREECLAEFGSACQRCGYDRSRHALHFHHTAEREGKSGRADPREVKSHPERFTLLCANCHFEEHDRIAKERHTIVMCPVCAKEYRSTPYLIAQGKNRYCSYACRDQARHRRALATETVTARFWKSVDRTDTCWMWNGNVGPDGHPRFMIWQDDHHVMAMARRFAYEIEHGHAPEGKLRACPESLLCVRPDHCTPPHLSKSM